MQRVVCILALVVIFAVIGVSFVMASPMHHEMGCPLMLGETVLCATGLEHFSHWKWALLGIATEVLLLFVFAAYAFGYRIGFDFHDPQTVRYKSFTRASLRPTLFQELFSNGILNPKPY